MAAIPMPRLAGVFAGGIPKLRSRGGVDTGGIIKRSFSYAVTRSHNRFVGFTSDG